MSQYFCFVLLLGFQLSQFFIIEIITIFLFLWSWKKKKNDDFGRAEKYRQFRKHISIKRTEGK
jgi:hypothetical protein